MIEDSIGYPFAGDNGVQILLVGGLLSLVSGVIALIISFLSFLTAGLSMILIPLAFLPTIPIFGYYVRVLKSTSEGDDTPPDFNNLGVAFKDGLFAIIIGLVYYALPLTIVIGTLLVGGGLGTVLGGDAGGTSFGIIAFFGIGVALILGIALTYIYPAALARYAVTDSIGAAFSFGKLTGVIFGTDYLVAWIFGFAILFAGGIVASLVGIIPLLGQLISPVIQFVFTIMAYRAFGLAYKAGTEHASQSSGGAAFA